ncbi:MAG TPA: AMP-binding protein [Burkholderiales bacterium]|nr:AMP-binding protein [Burkholderiales bacterium]
MAQVAAVSHAEAADVIARDAAGPVTVSRFLADVEAVASRLPSRAFLVNLCANRYRFAVGLVAAATRGQTSLLPPDRTPEMLRELREAHGDLYALIDAPVEACPVQSVAFPALPVIPASGVTARMPMFDAAQTAAIAFTSGSTGKPTPHRKSWGALARGAAAEAHRFGLSDGSRATLVATVPAQHMYGLESSVLMALHGGLSLHAARPFYPGDVAATLASVPGERVLVTTPVHLRALLQEGTPLPALRLVVCATAPLSEQLAVQAEERFGAPLHEVYGFTEAGMVATRRTVESSAWRCLRDVRLRDAGGAMRVGGGHVEVEAAFSDIIEPLGDDAFRLLGRDSDLVNIAGKRTSLGYLNHQISGIEGVRDAAFLLPEDDGHDVTRLTAFVHAPGLTRESLLEALRQRVDAVFLPRPLYFVDALPRNATGKLPREALIALARRCASGN